jgi:hypothetical protein|nr:MAG TPA: hypothetical protein [Caudoviricetes sp.]
MPREESAEAKSMKRIEGRKKEKQILEDKINNTEAWTQKEEELAGKIEEANQAIEKQNKELEK